MRKTPEIKIAPSILSADFARLGEQVAEVTRAGADYIHVDVMDGHFVPPITIGAAVVSAIRPFTDLPLDVHLMIEKPERQLGSFINAGANIITIHYEACLSDDITRIIKTIKESGVKAGVSINPETPIDVLYDILDSLDMVLIMTVHPGYAGQTFIKSTLEKVTNLRDKLDTDNLSAELEVDGGINIDTAPQVVEAGATVLVAGAAIFSTGNNVEEALKIIRASLY